MKKIMDIASNNKKPTEFKTRLFNGTYPLRASLKNWKVSKMTVVILHIHEHYVATTTLLPWLLQNGLLLLVHGTKFSKPIEEMSREEP